MPYTPEKVRNELEKETNITQLADYQASVDIKTFAGNMNYINFKQALYRINKDGKSYFLFVVIVGTLFLSIIEICRRFIFDYEINKEKENGDVE